MNALFQLQMEMDSPNMKFPIKRRFVRSLDSITIDWSFLCFIRWNYAASVLRVSLIAVHSQVCWCVCLAVINTTAIEGITFQKCLLLSHQMRRPCMLYIHATASVPKVKYLCSFLGGGAARLQPAWLPQIWEWICMLMSVMMVTLRCPNGSTSHLPLDDTSGMAARVMSFFSMVIGLCFLVVEPLAAQTEGLFSVSF